MNLKEQEYPAERIYYVIYEQPAKTEIPLMMRQSYIYKTNHEFCLDDLDVIYSNIMTENKEKKDNVYAKYRTILSWQEIKE